MDGVAEFALPELRVFWLLRGDFARQAKTLFEEARQASLGGLGAHINGEGLRYVLENRDAGIRRLCVMKWWYRRDWWNGDPSTCSAEVMSLVLAVRRRWASCTGGVKFFITLTEFVGFLCESKRYIRAISPSSDWVHVKRM